MTNLEHLPPDYDQRCATYRAALEQAYATGTVDAAARARLEAERERIGLQRGDAQQIEETYVREHAVALLERAREQIAALGDQHQREREQWERREYERLQREQAKWDREQREREQREHEQREHEQREHEQREREQREREQAQRRWQQQQWYQKGKCVHCGASLSLMEKLAKQTHCKQCIEEAQNHATHGNELLEKNMFDEAIAALTAALAINPDDADAYYNRGHAYQHNGDYARAIADYDQAIALNPNLVTAYNYCRHAYENRGDSQANQGNYDRAIEDYDRAIALYATDVLYYVLHYKRGCAYAEKGDYARAIEDYDQAIALNPNFALAYHSRGHAYARTYDHNRAFADLDYAIALDQNDAFAYYYRGNAYAQQGDYNRAIEDYDQAIALNPNFVMAYNNRGNAYYDTGTNARAIADYDQAIELDPNCVHAYYNRGNCFVNAEAYDRAIGDYTLVIVLNQGDADAYNNRGVAYYKKILDKDDPNPGAYVGEHDYNRAIADYTQAIAMNQNDADIYRNRGLAYRNRGLAYYKTRCYDQAIADYDQAIALNKNDALNYYNRGLAYAFKGDYDNAIAHVELFLKQGPDVQVLAGDLLHKIGFERLLHHNAALVGTNGIWQRTLYTLLTNIMQGHAPDVPAALRIRSGVVMGHLCTYDYDRRETLIRSRSGVVIGYDRPEAPILMYDPRLPLALVGLPAQQHTNWQQELDHYWCAIEAGPFWHNIFWTPKEWIEVYLLHPFHIARYLLTVADYVRFIDAGGYEDERWWTTRGWFYLQYGVDYDGFKRDTEPVISRLRTLYDSFHKSPLEPVYVTWYEACAYCRWLTAQGHAQGWLPDNEEVRVPTTLEWERAARHTDKRRYPWGDTYPTPEHGDNRYGYKTDKPVVGCFPLGAAACGAMDMVTNRTWIAKGINIDFEGRVKSLMYGIDEEIIPKKRDLRGWPYDTYKEELRMLRKGDLGNRTKIIPHCQHQAGLDGFEIWQLLSRSRYYNVVTGYPNSVRIVRALIHPYKNSVY